MVSHYEQYRLAIEAAEKVTDRRNAFNKFFITIISVLFTAITAFLTKLNENNLYILPLLIIGIQALFYLAKQIQYFKKLIKIKYETVKELENEFNIRETHNKQYKKIEVYKKMGK